jgi:hypothetical protein
MQRQSESEETWKERTTPRGPFFRSGRFDIQTVWLYVHTVQRHDQHQHQEHKYEHQSHRQLRLSCDSGHARVVHRRLYTRNKGWGRCKPRPWKPTNFLYTIGHQFLPPMGRAIGKENSHLHSISSPTLHEVGVDCQRPVWRFRSPPEGLEPKRRPPCHSKHYGRVNLNT